MNLLSPKSSKKKTGKNRHARSVDSGRRRALQRRLRAFSALLLAVGFFAAPPARAATGTDSRITYMSARGLVFLNKSRRIDGSYGKTEYPVAAQALAGIAFLACGYTPMRGEHAVQIRLGLRRLLQYQKKSGYFDDGKSQMYGHGYATLYLAEVLGMWGSPEEEKELRTALRKAIELIEGAQDRSGGWDYEPQSGGFSDCSVTVCQTMALRAARNIGLEVNKNVIDKAIRYIERAQAPSGGFYYRIADRFDSFPQKTTPGCSAAGVCILNSLGKYDTARVGRGLAYLEKNYRNIPDIYCFFYYTHYYAAQAFYRSRPTTWETYYNYVSDALLKRQQGDGSWEFTQGTFIKIGKKEPVIATAFAVFILNVPRAVLPITEK